MIGALAILAICGGTIAALSDHGRPKTAFNDPIGEASPGKRSSVASPDAYPGSKMASARSPQAPRTAFGDGTWEVGKDIEAGTYTTQVPRATPVCYWEREKALSGVATDIIANGTVPASGQGKVTIDAKDKGFKSQGCGTWTRTS